MNTNNSLTVQTAQLNTVKSIPDYITDFCEYIDVKETSARTYISSLKRFCKYLNDKSISQPVREDIIDYREKYLIEELHLSANTVQLYMIAVKKFFKWTAMNNYYENVADGVKGVNVPKMHRKDYLTTNQVHDVLDQIEDDTSKGLRDKAVIALMVTCGLRDIEVSRANIEDIRTYGNQTVIEIQGKGQDGKNDFVTLPVKTEQMIRKYLSTRKNTSKEEPLFTSVSNRDNGSRLTTRSISRIVKEALKEAGLDSSRLTAHSLRHTAVTQALLAGNTLQTVQQFARHSNINTTLIYAHNLEKQNNPCSESLASRLL